MNADTLVTVAAPVSDADAPFEGLRANGLLPSSVSPPPAGGELVGPVRIGRALATRPRSGCRARPAGYGLCDQQHRFALSPLPQTHGSFRPMPRQRTSDAARRSAMMASESIPCRLRSRICFSGCST